MARRGQRVAVNKMDMFTRGTSRQTWFIEYTPAQTSKRQTVTLRTDHPEGSGDPTSLVQEYGVYKRLGNTAIPHARALRWEDDPCLAPRPFYLRETVDGSWRVANFGGHSREAGQASLAASQAHMKALAVVHDADWRAAGFSDLLPSPADEVDAAGAYIRLQAGRFAEFRGEPNPLLHEVETFLLADPPPAARISLCKGTNGLGEEVFRNGDIVAMSDWEEVIIGDPASDLAMVQGFTQPLEIDGHRIWDLEIAVDYYNQFARTPVSLENVRYYQLARLFGRLVMFAYTSKVVARSGEATVRQSWTATEVQHVVKRAIAGALGMMPPINPSIFEELNESVESFSGAVP